jgi:hypothetical protein
VELALKQSDGSTLRQHLQVGERVWKRWDERLHREVPEAMAHLWRWFRELAMGRTFTEYGAQALSHAEIDAWARLRRIELSSKELDVLRMLDAVMLNVLREDGKHG